MSASSTPSADPSASRDNRASANPLATAAFDDNDLNARAIINQILAGSTAGCAPFNNAVGSDFTGQATLVKNGTAPVYTACAHILQYMIPANAPVYRAIRFAVPGDLNDVICKVIFLRDLSVAYNPADGSFPGSIVDPIGAAADISTDPKKEGWLSRFMAVCAGQQPATGFEKLGEVTVGPDDAGLSVECPINAIPNTAGVIWMVVAVQATVGAGPFTGPWNFGSTAWSADGLALVS